MEKLNIFISSTCYDLSQVRSDLQDFVSNLGHTPILSELNSFPINAVNTKTVENCIEAVKNHADVFVLIVGNRYGSVIETGKSITNTEYLTAKNKGIPVYIFIEQRLLNILEVWKKNKNGDYTNIVDNNQIFEFVSELREVRAEWTFPFQEEQDIESTLSIQLSYLFKGALKLKQKYEKASSDIMQLPISTEAFKVFLEKGEVYEFEFFSQALVDESKKKEHLINDVLYKIYYEPKHFFFKDDDVFDWLKSRMATATVLINTSTKLILERFKEYYGELGTPSDLKGLFYTATSYGRLLESFAQLQIDTNNIEVPEKFLEIKEAMAKFLIHPMQLFWSFPKRLYDLVMQLKLDTSNTEVLAQIRESFTIEVDNDAYQELMRAFQNYRS